MKNKVKRSLSWLLTAVMLLGMLPTTVLAEELNLLRVSISSVTRGDVDDLHPYELLQVESENGVGTLVCTWTNQMEEGNLVVYDNADEVETSYDALTKYLAGKITMDDVDFSRHKLLKSDMEAVKELKKEPYDDFSLDKWNLDSDLAKGHLPRLVSILVGGSPCVNDKYVPVYNAYNGQTETMETKWANLKKMEEETFAKIIMGKADISEFDTFVENWKNQGGDQILKEINDELGK